MASTTIRIFKGSCRAGRLAVDVTLAFGDYEGHTPTHGYEPTREAAMAAFAKSCRRK